MIPLPEDVALALLRGVGAYLRATPPQELPAAVRRFKGFRAAALAKHRDRLLALLDDETQRALVLQWMKEEKPPLSKDDAELLRIAAEASEGWEQELRARSAVPEAPPESSVAAEAQVESALAKERDKARKAKDELKELRAELGSQQAAAMKRVAAAEARAEELSERVARLEAEVKRAESGLRSETERADRELRRARADAEKAAARADDAAAETKQLRRELEQAQARIVELQAGTKRKKAAAPTSPTPDEPSSRKRLSPPKGRFADDPETLGAWLDEPNVILVIDGYNVTKAEGGFGDLELPVQRDRLIQEATKIARRHEVTGHIVFDGNVVPPGSKRGPRGPLKVAYSRPDEIADDHIVALIETLPKHPVVVVTNDKELQHRAAALGATIATSTQFLKLTR